MLSGVLENLQKDFKGVSSECLGSKIDGYGSFLASCDRSLFWSCPGAPDDIQPFISSKTTIDSHSEGGHCSWVSSSPAIQPVGFGPPSQISPPLLKEAIDSSGPPLLYESTKRIGNGFTSRYELGNIKATTFPKQNSLKVRIKVGPDNKVTRESTTICSNLGLDVSPSSSLDDVHLADRQLLTDSVHCVISYPQIIQMMTSFPVPGEQPLSPLSDDLFLMTEKEILLNGGKSLATRNMSHCPKYDENLLGKKNSNYTRACEELLNSPNIPILFHSSSAFGNDELREMGFSEVIWEDPAYIREEGCNEKPKATCENENASFRQCALVSGSNDDLMVSKGRKSQNSEVKELSRKKGALHCKSLEDRQRNKHSNQPKEALMIPSYSLNKMKNVINENKFEAKRMMKVFKAQEKDEKSEDRYRDFFGDIELEDDDENCTSPFKSHNASQMEESGTVEKCSHVNIGIQKDKSGGRKISKVPLPKLDPHAAVHSKAQSGNAPVSIGVSATDSALIKENWVCCDKCEKWRLLPPVLTPESLPEKWLCIMLDWLPGMNRCSVSEEETTNAVHALIQVPVKVHPDNGVVTTSHDKSNQNLPSRVMAANGKMKHGFREPSNTFKHNKTQFSNSERKSRLAVVDNGNLDAHAQFCMVGKSEAIKQRRADNGIVGGRLKPKPNEERRVNSNSSDGGKRELDQHCHIPSKKIRTEALLEDAMHDQHCHGYDKITKSNIQKNLIAPSKEKVKGSSSNDKHTGTEMRNDVGVKKKRKSFEKPILGHEMESFSQSKIHFSHISKGNFCVAKVSPVDLAKSTPKVTAIRKNQNKKENITDVGNDENIKISHSVTSRGETICNVIDKDSLKSMDSCGEAKRRIIPVRNESNTHVNVSCSGRCEKEFILQKHSYSSSIDCEDVAEEKQKADSAENNKRYHERKDSVWPLSNEREQRENLARIGGTNDQEVAGGAAQDHFSRPPLELKKVDEGDATGHLTGILHCSSKNDAHTVIRDPSRQFAMNVIKEATNLKHMADRLKNSGLDSESINLYFEAALKFLHGACLLESCCSRISKSGEMVQSMQIYSSTAKLCEFCANEYEKNKYMGSAALAYKCMEVAYMRVVYMSYIRANGDQCELKMVLGMLPKDGSSSSSSASDIDNLNHSTTMEKALLAKENNSSKVSMIRPMTGKHRASCLRLLEFTRDVDSAVEASRKSQFAFCAVNTSLGDSQNREAVSSVKTAIDFNFQDVQGFVWLVRLAVEALGN